MLGGHPGASGAPATPPMRSLSRRGSSGGFRAKHPRAGPRTLREQTPRKRRNYGNRGTTETAELRKSQNYGFLTQRRRANAETQRTADQHSLEDVPQKSFLGFSAALRSSLRLCVKNSAVPCARTRAKASGNGLWTDRLKRNGDGNLPQRCLGENGCAVRECRGRAAPGAECAVHRAEGVRGSARPNATHPPRSEAPSHANVVSPFPVRFSRSVSFRCPTLFRPCSMRANASGNGLERIDRSGMASESAH